MTARKLLCILALSTTAWGQIVCSPDSQANCPTTAPATGDISGTAYARGGIPVGIHVLQGIQYNTSFTTCTPPNSSCTVMDCFWEIGTLASRQSNVIIMGVHSGGGNSNNRDMWLSLTGNVGGTHPGVGYGGIVITQSIKNSTVCNIDYRLAPGARFPAGVQDIRCAMAYIVADGGTTIPGDRTKFLIPGDSWSGLLVLDTVLTLGLSTGWGDVCTSTVPANFSVVRTSSSYGVVCAGAGCTNTSYHYTDDGSATAMRQAINDSLGSSSEGTAATADTAIQMSPIFWMTQGNPNLGKLSGFFYGVNDSLVCYQIGAYTGTGTSCGSAGNSGPMNNTVAVNTLAALSPPITVRNAGYPTGGHEAAFTGNVNDTAYQQVIWSLTQAVNGWQW